MSDFSLYEDHSIVRDVPPDSLSFRGVASSLRRAQSQTQAP